MNKVRRTGAVVALTLIFAVSAVAGTIHSPGAVDPPPPSQEASPSTTISTTSIATDVLLTIINLIS
jgi:hypothetical protein